MTLNSKQLSAVFLCGLFLLPDLSSALAQVSPAEIKDLGLRETERNYFSQLIALNQAISALTFPYKLSLNRYVGLDPKDQAGADTRGLEYVMFHERQLLKMSANYNAAFNADLLTPNQRADRVLSEVILPVLRLLPQYFNQDASFDGFGFEIGYHVRKHKPNYDLEGRENLVVVFDKADALRYPLQEDASRQEILNRSEIYLNGEIFGLALNSKSPMETEALVRRPSASAKKGTAPPGARAQAKPPQPDPTPKTAASAAPPVTVDVAMLLKKYEAPLERLAKDGVAEYHFVDYAPPSFVIIQDRVALQATLRNPQGFDKQTTSIYKRAARCFDLFLAPQLKGLLSKIPESPDFSAVDFSVVNELTSANEKSSEAIEFILPLQEARQFANAQITNQDLIDKSIVMINGVRIALNLAQVE